MTIVKDIPTNRPIIDKAMEYSKPAATSLLGTTNVVIVEKIFVKFKNIKNQSTKI